MAFKKTLAQRLFNITKIANNRTLTNCRVGSSILQSGAGANNPSSNNNIAPDPGDNGISRRFLHKKAVLPPEFRSFPMGENLVEKLRSMDIAKDRIRLEGLTPPLGEKNSPEKEGLTVDDTKKLLRLAQLEAVKSRLRGIEKKWITYPEFVRICGEACLDPEQGIGFAKTLDESGSVIVLGNLVFLRPEQVTKAIQSLIPNPRDAIFKDDPRKKELRDLEKQKEEIDRRAETLVRRELWGGLGFLVVQTAGFMRLTFWELSWDVMEPICFYVTSMYFMAGYAFFLRTSKEPSFEGFFESRFRAKQRKLMRINNFDLARYSELKKVFYPQQASVSQDHRKIQFEAVEDQ